MTAAGVGCADPTAVVTGVGGAGSGPRTTTGDVVLGANGWSAEVRSADANAMLSSFGSSFGNWVEGCTSATAGFSGRGGTRFLALVLLPSQITTVGTGISCGERYRLGDIRLEQRLGSLRSQHYPSHRRRLGGGVPARREFLLDGMRAELLDAAAGGALHPRLKSVQVNMPHFIFLGEGGGLTMGWETSPR